MTTEEAKKVIYEMICLHLSTPQEDEALHIAYQALEQQEYEKEWHRYPEERPSEEGRYLVCYPLGTIPPAPFILIARWGKSEECEWHDKSLKRKKAYWYIIDYEYGNYALNNVYAWMPLPEPMPLPNERKGT